MKSSSKLALALTGVLGLAALARPAAAADFTATGPYILPAPGAGTTPATIGTASVYPITFDVAGLTGPTTDVNLTFTNLSHTFPDDLDMLLVDPTGVPVLFWSDAGGGTDIVAGTVTIDDQAAIALPDSTAITSGSYQPANYLTGDTFAAPAPAGPYSLVALSSFNGLSPNGTWSLYITDDAGGDAGSLDSVTLSVTAGVPEPTTLGLAGVGALALLRRRRA